MMPFFTFYGGKFRAAKHYPRPFYDRIVEPFAGSAGYSLNYPDCDVLLGDVDPFIVETWRYLIGADPDEIAALPDLEPGQSVYDIDGLADGARHLIGWWLNKGSARPKHRASTFMLQHPAGGPYWGERIRDRIAEQVPSIRHWQIEQQSFELSPDIEATWFIDPPYQLAGSHYRFGSSGIDYSILARWCRTRQGQTIVCEADDAAWLPFSTLTAIDGNEGRQKQTRARTEALWLSSDTLTSSVP